MYFGEIGLEKLTNQDIMDGKSIPGEMRGTVKKITLGKDGDNGGKVSAFFEIEAAQGVPFTIKLDAQSLIDVANKMPDVLNELEG